MRNMRTIVPGQIPTRDLHQFIVGSVAPRPIAFVSTIDENGVPNLAPYSFFNAFSSNPPIVVFSSNRRVSDNTTKDTLHNVRETGEVVINMVNYDIVRQMAVASVEFPSDVSEFDKTGLTPMEAEEVKPFRVSESPVHLECKVKDIITLGEHGGAGHLVICHVLKMHIREEVIDERNRIDPQKLDLMGRLGRSYYVRVKGDAIHTIVQPVTKLTIGYDALPEHVRHSTVLTGNELGMLAGAFEMPDKNAIIEYSESNERLQRLINDKAPTESFHSLASELLSEFKVNDALKTVLASAGTLSV